MSPDASLEQEALFAFLARIPEEPALRQQLNHVQTAGDVSQVAAAAGHTFSPEVLIAVFLTVTTPVTLMLLGRAALYRDRSENAADVPPPIRADGEIRSGDTI